MSNKKLLLIEDDITLGDLLVEVLQRHGYQTDWYVRARLNQQGRLIFMTDRGLESDFDCRPADYDFALVDSRLKGCLMQGVDVTAALTARGVKVIASSGLSSLNKEMLKAGAVAAVEKHDLFSHIYNNDDLLQQLTRPAKKSR